MERATAITLLQLHHHPISACATGHSQYGPIRRAQQVHPHLLALQQDLPAMGHLLCFLYGLNYSFKGILVACTFTLQSHCTSKRPFLGYGFMQEAG